MLSDEAKVSWLNKYQQKDKEKINQLVQAVKQLNKEIKELKELDVEVSEKDINEALNLTLDKAFHHHYYEKEK